jgi:hypothetical protein
MTFLPFATVLSFGLALPAVGMAQSFNPLWAVPSTAINSSGNTPALLAPAAKTSPQANFFAGVSGYGPRLKAVAAPSHTDDASSMAISN